MFLIYWPLNTFISSKTFEIIRFKKANVFNLLANPGPLFYIFCLFVEKL